MVIFHSYVTVYQRVVAGSLHPRNLHEWHHVWDVSASLPEFGLPTSPCVLATLDTHQNSEVLILYFV